ncbi:uncharacterized protein LOC123528829 isoform X1 [Mercenaria mercenaria]|uniref:uncharacterized protein LOC123528829 isoform X1 n=1 Tax=Mercenaria mercenaria TaxID=6596 RepID=UPI00234F5E18|nr:uncharacterized protein LOC123528829 isoform X1 [Mercenaria mercenaria]
MRKLMEFTIYLFGVLAVANGCSEPEGGYKEPTPASNVFFSKHVVVGEVTEIIRPDPLFGDTFDNSTYGASVTVQCTYKGGPLPGSIQIGGAGFIPGHCTSMDLVKGQKYVMFLNAKEENSDSYQQTPEQPAVSKSKLMDYLNVCDLYMQYPEENGIPLKRKVCPQESKLDTCQRHTETDAAATAMASLSAMLFCVAVQLL